MSERTKPPGTPVSDNPFGDEDTLSFERQRQAHRFLTQETRYYIIQALLGHPHHLASFDELEYLVPKNRSTIDEHLDRLEGKQLLAKYEYTGDESAQNEPTEFWGFTEFGIELLYDFDYLRYVPVLRVVQDHLYVTEKIQRHRDARRPDLPESVAEAFDLPEEMDGENRELLETEHSALVEGGQLFDAPPVDPDPDAETEGDADRPIDELF
ncbi:hypothetical protein SAMN05216559_3719 [Halomicrobium zhouii]|uniref:Helix-turn-helix domain-containing protein n=1 Tax=Halomicrobium zhouii TaxID=767519 RepID=A0A1I6M424_9EURY|nr:hypothetical protein [Halomicrobium zhouii]SFS10388.1 hypothetical protein SAMN05216559_3719 [Halomicrobium zhouii]